MEERYPRVRLFRFVLLVGGWLMVVAGGLGMAMTVIGGTERALFWLGVLVAGACMLGAGQVLLLLLQMAEEVTEVRGMLILHQQDVVVLEPEEPAESEDDA